MYFIANARTFFLSLGLASAMPIAASAAQLQSNVLNIQIPDLGIDQKIQINLTSSVGMIANIDVKKYSGQSSGGAQTTYTCATDYWFPNVLDLNVTFGTAVLAHKAYSFQKAFSSPTSADDICKPHYFPRIDGKLQFFAGSEYQNGVQWEVDANDGIRLQINDAARSRDNRFAGVDVPFSAVWNFNTFELQQFEFPTKNLVMVAEHCKINRISEKTKLFYDCKFVSEQPLEFSSVR
jgi:hypothetical protein